MRKEEKLTGKAVFSNIAECERELFLARFSLALGGQEESLARMAKLKRQKKKLVSNKYKGKVDG